MKHRYKEIRNNTTLLCSPLEIEDLLIQSCPDVSPPKWHLAHTTWFFEKFILQESLPNYRVFNEKFNYLFNSYYKTVGNHWNRLDRSKLSRPTVKEVWEYREYVDEFMLELMKGQIPPANQSIIEIGLHHEQQHQELLLMDIKHILSLNPISAVYENAYEHEPIHYVPEKKWFAINGGVHEFGATEGYFSYDNESPRHERFIHAAKVSKNLVSNAEFMEFIQDSGYERPELWMSLGWDWVNQNEITSPLYWRKHNDRWFEFTLYGEKELEPNWPVQHVSFFEADAFARWKGLRLPSEFELELLSNQVGGEESFASLHSVNLNTVDNNLWCWSKDQYQPYPGYQAYEGSLGEYNQKFMCNQFTMRNGSYATPKGHYRPSYRNFFEPWQRWMFSGVRLAKDND